MLLFPPAKINLGLNIVEKRTDGFHNIQSIFLAIGLTDILEMISNNTGKIQFTCTGISIPNESENLCIQAYDLIKRDYHIKGVTMHLHKVIPIGAGLGGGSADASFALKGLNELFDLNLSDDRLMEYAAELGSDCPFFISSKPAYVEGRGEVLSEINLDLKGYHLVVVNPGIHIGTKEAFQGVVPRVPVEDLKNLTAQDFDNWQPSIQNQFEETILVSYPMINEIKLKLWEAGAVYASMTGTGSSVYGFFKERPDKNPDFKEMFYWEGPI